MLGRKKYPVMVRLPELDRNWVREQARLLEKLTGTYSESAVIRLAIRKVREWIALGRVDWELSKTTALDLQKSGQAGRGGRRKEME